MALSDLLEYRNLSRGMVAPPGYTGSNYKWVNFKEALEQSASFFLFRSPWPQGLIDHIKSNLFRNLRQQDTERWIHAPNPTIGSSNLEEWRLQLGTWILLKGVSVSILFPVWGMTTTFINRPPVRFFGAKFIYISNEQMEIIQPSTHQRCT